MYKLLSDNGKVLPLQFHEDFLEIIKKERKEPALDSSVLVENEDFEIIRFCALYEMK